MIPIIIIFILIVLFIIFKLCYDKLIFVTIKLNEIEEKISSTLIKRRELLNDAEKIIKKVAKTDKEIFEGLEELNNENIKIIELDRRLNIHFNAFNLIKEKYKKLEKDEDFEKISFTINETDDLLKAYKEYYNTNALSYNKIIKSFPIILLTIIKGRKEKQFFDKEIN